jgi:hypothetical protein
VSATVGVVPGPRPPRAASPSVRAPRRAGVRCGATDYEIMDVLVGLVQEVGLGKKTAEEVLKEGQSTVAAICAKCTL